MGVVMDELYFEDGFSFADELAIRLAIRDSTASRDWAALATQFEILGRGWESLGGRPGNWIPLSKIRA